MLQTLRKLGNIVRETLAFLSMFLCLVTSRNIVRGAKFTFQGAKGVPTKISDGNFFLVCQLVSDSISTAKKNIVSTAMFPNLPKLAFPLESLLADYPSLYIALI